MQSYYTGEILFRWDVFNVKLQRDVADFNIEPNKVVKIAFIRFPKWAARIVDLLNTFCVTWWRSTEELYNSIKIIQSK